MGNKNAREVPERSLLEEVSEALLEWGHYTEDEIEAVMRDLEKVKVKNVKVFAILERSQLEATDMPPAIVAILLHKFGDKKSRTTGVKESGWKRAWDILKAAVPVAAGVGTATAQVVTTVRVGMETHQLRMGMKTKLPFDVQRL